MARKPRGTMDYRYDSTNKIVVTRWNDNSVVTLASNCQVVNPVGKAKWYSGKESKIIEIDEPYVVRYYNQNMGGANRMDKNISFYRIPVRIKEMVDAIIHFYAWCCHTKCLAALQEVRCKQVKTTQSVGFQKRICRYLPPKIFVAATWGWLCWTPNSCCFKKACKSTWTSSLWWAGKLSRKQPYSKKMYLLWHEGQVHLWKVQCRTSHWLFFFMYIKRSKNNKKW